jgi:DNA-directed RNA polymerase II subunit RPB2
MEVQQEDPLFTKNSDNIEGGNTDKLPELEKNDLTALLYAEIDRKGIAGHHIQSMNTFYKIGLKQIITKIFTIELEPMENKRNSTEEDREIRAVSCKVIFTDVRLKPPSTANFSSGYPMVLTPNMARLNNSTYSSALFVDAEIEARAYLHNGGERVRVEKINDWRIASIPVMVGSEICTTYNQTKETLKQLEEDPHDIGGYFIIKGNEWVVEMVENPPINSFQVYRNMHQNEIARGSFVSKPGDYYDNSYMLTFKYLQSGAITIEITVNTDEHLVMPFYILYRLFGMTNDRDIINNIVYGVENTDTISITLINVLTKAFMVEDSKAWSAVRHSTDPVKILEHISSIMNSQMISNFKKDDNLLKWFNSKTIESIDRRILPHLGNSVESRIKKLRFIGHLIHKLLLVELGVIESSDRDSYENKRIHTAGINLARL